MKTWRIVGVFFSTLTLLIGCGGGNTQTAGGGSGGTGSVVSYGPISNVKLLPVGVQIQSQSRAAGTSVTVNGVEYDTTGATITMPDGSTATTDALRQGMLVTVRGPSTNGAATGTATSVTYSNSLRGQLSGLAPTATGVGYSFTLYGMNVVTDNLTSILDQNGIAVTGSWTPATDWVEVSGYVDGNGKVVGTYVQELAMAPGEVEIEGPVTAINGNIITVNATTQVDISGVSTVIAVGDYVDVVAQQAASGDTLLIATSVQVETREMGGEDDDEAEISGMVTSVSATGFSVAGQPVVTDANTVFNGGLLAAIVPGTMVEVSGTFIGGSIVATDVTFDDEVELMSTVLTVTNGIFTLEGLPGLEISYDAVLTEGDAPVAGDVVQVRARNVGTNGAIELLATQIEISTDPEDQGLLELQGAVTAVNPSTSFEVLGITVNAADITEWNVEGETAAAFFEQVQTGRIVSVEGIHVGNVAHWQFVEFED